LGECLTKYCHYYSSIVACRIDLHTLALSDAPEELFYRKVFRYFVGLLKRGLQFCWQLCGEVFGLPASDTLAKGL